MKEGNRRVESRENSCVQVKRQDGGRRHSEEGQRLRPADYLSPDGLFKTLCGIKTM